MAEFKTDSSWYDESGKIKYENILDLINAYVVAGVTKDEDIRVKVGPTVWQDYQDILSKRSENNRSKKTNDNINYGKKGERVEEIAKALYTDKKYGSKVEDLARKLKDGKVFDSDKTEYGNYRIEMNSNTARVLGEFLADNQEGLRKGVLTDDNGNIKFTSKNKIFSEFDDNDLYKINTSYGERVKYNEDSKAINDYMSGVQDRIGYGDNDIKNKINNLEKDGIFEKLKQGKTLTEDEIKRFNEVKNEYLDTKKGLEDIAKQRGIYLNGKSVFGLPEQKTAKNKKTGEEYKYWDFSENSKITEMSFSSPVYNSFSRAQELGIEKYDVNADGTFKEVDVNTGKIENPNEKLLKDVDNSNNFKSAYNKQIDAFYKSHEIAKDVLENEFDNSYRKVNNNVEQDFFRDHQSDILSMSQDEVENLKAEYISENKFAYDEQSIKRDFGDVSIDKAKARYFDENRYDLPIDNLDKQFYDSMYSTLDSSDGKAFYGDKNAENLYKLKQRGVKLTTEENKILQDYAIAYQGGIKDTDDVITDLKKASSNAFNGYDINTNNIDYINAKEGFKLLRDDDGKVTIDESSLDDDVKNSKEYIDNYKGKVIDGETDLSGLAKKNILAKEKRALKGNENTYEDFLTNVENEIKGMSSPQIKDSGLGLSRREQLVRMGMEDKYAKEIDEAIGSDNKGSLKNVSLDAMKSYKSNKSAKLEDYEVELGKVTNEQIDVFTENNKKAMEKIITDKQYKKLEEMNYEDKKKLMSEMFGISDRTSRVGGAMKLHMTGKKLNSADDVKDFYNELTDGGEIKLDKLKGIFEVENRNSTSTMGKLLSMAFGKKSISELKKDSERDEILKTVSKALDDAVGKYGDGLSAEEKEKISKVSTRFKDREFTEQELSALDGIVSEAQDYKEKYEKIEGKGFSDTVKKISGNKTLRTVAGVAAAIGGIGLVANAVSKASEERERKRQEMNQLIAMQSSSLRGGY